MDSALLSMCSPFRWAVIADARRRQARRRRNLVTLAAVVVALAGVQVLRSGGLAGVLGHERSSSVVARTFSSLTPDPDLDNHCAVINSVACDTIEFDVELSSPARSVVVSIGSRTLKLQPIPSGDGFPAPGEITRSGSGPWTGFYGYLQPSSSPIAVTQPATARPRNAAHGRDEQLHARLSITYADGQQRIASSASQPIRAYDNTRGSVARRLAQAEASRVPH